MGKEKAAGRGRQSKAEGKGSRQGQDRVGWSRTRAEGHVGVGQGRVEGGTRPRKV